MKSLFKFWCALSFIFLLSSLPAKAQGYYRDISLTWNGVTLVPNAGATVTVCASSAFPIPNVPCSPTVPIYADAALSVPKTNPITTGSDGSWSLYAPAGDYAYTVTGTGLLPQGPFLFVILPLTTGTVTSFSAGNLASFCTTSVANSFSTPSLTFSCPAGAHSYLGNTTGSTGNSSFVTWPGSTGEVYYNSGGNPTATTSLVYDPATGKLGIGADGSSSAPCFYMGAFADGAVICEASGLTINAELDQPVFLGTRNGSQDYEFGGCTTSCSLAVGNLPGGTAFFGGGSTHSKIYLNDGASSAGSRQGPFLSGDKVPFGTLSACDATIEGSLQPATDSMSATWGDVYTGGGMNHVLLYCDGTDWTVTAK